MAIKKYSDTIALENVVFKLTYNFYITKYEESNTNHSIILNTQSEPISEDSLNCLIDDLKETGVFEFIEVSRTKSFIFIMVW